MNELLYSPFFGLMLTTTAYAVGVKVQKKTGLVICNGLVLAALMIIAVLLVFDIPYEAYGAGGSLINLLLTPATVCFAVTIYRRLEVLKKNLLPVLVGCAAGAVASVTSVWVLCRLFGLDRALTMSLLPKSVTTPIATALAQSNGGVCDFYRHRRQSGGAADGAAAAGEGSGGGGTGHRRLQPCYRNGQSHGTGRDRGCAQQRGPWSVRHPDHAFGAGIPITCINRTRSRPNSVCSVFFSLQTAAC